MDQDFKPEFYSGIGLSTFRVALKESKHISYIRFSDVAVSTNIRQELDKY